MEGQVGGLECNDETRRDLARRSISWRCRECAAAEGATAEGKTNEEVLDEERRRWLEMGGDTGTAGNGATSVAEHVPPELRVGYRDELKTGEGIGSVPLSDPTFPQTGAASAAQAPIVVNSQPVLLAPPTPTSPTPPHITPTAAPNIPLPPEQGSSLRQRPPATDPPPPQQRNRPNHHHHHHHDHRHHHPHLQQQIRNPPSPNIDRLIYFLLFLIAALLWRKLGKMEVELIYAAGI